MPIQHLHQGLAAGRPWVEVLLEAVGLWTTPNEWRHGRTYTYLLQAEAFDWLVLAERLLEEVNEESVPQTEREQLLFAETFPSSVTQRQFQEALGQAKYQAHLNFFYGVVVEEALMHAVEEEVIKESGLRGVSHRRGVDDLVMRRLYGDDLDTLIRRFYQSVGKRYTKTMTLAGWKTFVYWLFRLRVAQSDQSRLASDTTKGLRQLEAVRSGAAAPSR